MFLTSVFIIPYAIFVDISRCYANPADISRHDVRARRPPGKAQAAIPRGVVGDPRSPVWLPGEQIIAQPTIIALLAVPILIQVYFNSGLAYLLNQMSGEQHCVAGPSALIGASNFFKLAVAAAISLFGFQSGAAIATLVGVLIELSVVWVVNRSKSRHEASPAVIKNTASERAQS
jgi:hypothetical protein